MDRIVVTNEATFEWDERKNQANIDKHGLSFEQTIPAFFGTVLTERDLRRDYGEERLRTLGRIRSLLVVVIIHTDRRGRVRIISARPANRMERDEYDEAL